jgi:hypothetical protein
MSGFSFDEIKGKPANPFNSPNSDKSELDKL